MFTRSKPAFGGGGAHPPYPHYVWSPAGGWWPNPAAWKRNTAIAFTVIFVSGLYVFCVSAELEVHHNSNARLSLLSIAQHRPVAPKMNIPSRYWSKVPPVEEE